MLNPGKDQFKIYVEIKSSFVNYNLNYKLNVLYNYKYNTFCSF